MPASGSDSMSGKAATSSETASAVPWRAHETAVIDEGATIGAGCAIWHWTHICAGAVIGEHCSFGQNVFVGNDVRIGSHVKIQNNVSVYDAVTLEDGVFCGPSMVFTNVYNPRAMVSRKDEYRRTLVRRGATLGANCTVICGVTMGAYAMIGAGAVVTRDVRAHALIVGVPAKQVGWVSHAGEVLDDSLTCPREGRRYRVDEAGDLQEVSTD